MPSRTQLLKALDEALELQIIKLAGVLFIAPESDDLAMKRFGTGLDKAIAVYDELVELVTDMTEGEEEVEPWLRR